jgi:molybdopterin-containing oxidoreductase family membrane subunit
MKYNKARIAIWISIGIAMVIGAISVYNRFVHGLMITDLGSYMPWGLWISQDIYFIGLSAGAFLISALVYVFGVKTLEPIGPLSLFTALIALITSLVHVWFDLGHLERFWHFYTSPNWGSLLNYIAWAYSVYFLLLLAELFLAMKQKIWTRLNRIYPPETAAKDKRYLKIIAIIGIPLAISFHGGVGAVFGVLVARPYWHVGLYPVLFIIAALASGAASLTFIVAFFLPKREEYQKITYFLGRLTLGLLLLETFFIFADYFQTLYQGIPQNQAAVKAVLGGPYSWAFWGIQIFMGTLVPVFILAYPRWSRRPSLVGIAGLLIVISFFLARMNLIYPALAVPEMEGLVAAFKDPRLTFCYVPTLMEWGLSIGIMGFAGLLFLIGYDRLKLAER